MNLHIENNNIHVNHDGPDGPQGFSLDGIGVGVFLMEVL